MAEKKSDKKEENEKRTIPPLEWLTAALGLIIVTGAVSFLIYGAWADEDKPPILKVSAGAVVKNDAGYLVEFTVQNDGDRTAADVVVEAKLRRGAEDIETSSVTLDYAPAHSTRSGGIYFKSNPQEAGQIEIIAKGYREP